ncbi:MAG: hypothetical protein U0X91_20875 [Spirosomataceae bacterium]
MNIIWKNSVVGAELVLENHENEEPERVLGAVEIAHGYAFGWAYNSLGNKIYLPSLFSEKFELAKENVYKYLDQIGLIPKSPTHETTA